MNAEVFANELYDHWKRTREGAEQALKIADRNMKACSPENWSNLPVGPVFATKGYGSDKWDLNTRLLRYNYNFWSNVYYVLRKKF
jgi:hypothetical protein